MTSKELENFFHRNKQRKLELQFLHDLICKHAPNLDISVMTMTKDKKMIAYGLMDYKTKSNKESIKWPILALANQKNYISIYACAVVDGKYISEKYTKNLGKVSVGKSCIRFSKIENLNIDTLKELIIEINELFTRDKKVFGI